MESAVASESRKASLTVSVADCSPAIQAVAITAAPAATRPSVRPTDGLRVGRIGARCCPDVSAMSSSAVTTSLATCGRSSGSLASRRAMSAASGGGTSPRDSASGAGSRVSCAAIVFCGESSLKGTLPVSIS